MTFNDNQLDQPATTPPLNSTPETATPSESVAQTPAPETENTPPVVEAAPVSTETETLGEANNLPTATPSEAAPVSTPELEPETLSTTPEGNDTNFAQVNEVPETSEPVDILTEVDPLPVTASEATNSSIETPAEAAPVNTEPTPDPNG